MGRYVSIPGNAYIGAEDVEFNISSLKFELKVKKSIGCICDLQKGLENALESDLTGFTFTWRQEVDLNSIQGEYGLFTITCNEVDLILRKVLGKWYEHYEKEFKKKKLAFPTMKEIMKYGV